MALNQRKTTRWARVGTWVLETGVLVPTALKAFLNFKEEDGLWDKGGKTVDIAVRRTAYLLADYGLWAVSVALFTTMKTLGFSLFAIFIALWIYESMAAGGFVFFYEMTGKDLSLGADFRRAKDAVNERSRVAGYLVMLLVIALAVVWTGPEKIITFFRKEIGDASQVAYVLLALTGIQASIWAILYNLGYGLVVEFF